jgi:Sec-independent protein translocase protein TatA
MTPKRHNQITEALDRYGVRGWAVRAGVSAFVRYPEVREALRSAGATSEEFHDWLATATDEPAAEAQSTQRRQESHKGTKDTKEEDGRRKHKPSSSSASSAPLW